MPSTANRSYPYPARGDLSRYGWRDVQQLAEAIDLDVAAEIAARQAYQSALEAAWTSYTPTFAANGGGAAVGNGTISGKYKRLGTSGKTCVARVKLTIGSTSSSGSGFWTFTLPFTAAAVRDAVGAVYILDSGSADRGGCICYNNTTTTIAAVTPDDLNVDSVNPHSWATGDIFLATIEYETA